MRVSTAALAVIALAACAGPPASSGPPGVQGALTPAPVPAVGPGVPGSNGSGIVAEQVVAPGGTAGPRDATPFSTNPSSELPPEGVPRDSIGLEVGAPNLSK